MQIIIVYVDDDIQIRAERPVNAPVRLCMGKTGLVLHLAVNRPTEAHRGQYRRWHRMGKAVDYDGQRH